jgi:hypothetical protein
MDVIDKVEIIRKELKEKTFGLTMKLDPGFNFILTKPNHE